MADADIEKYRAPALDKGLDILELLAGTADGLSQAEIAKALDRTPNEIYRMLDRLVRRDYVRRTGAERYELTLKLFELAHLSPPMQRLVRQADHVLRRFARDAQQAVHLVIPDRNVLIVVGQVDSPGFWNVSIRVGSRLGIRETGSGQTFLAFATDEERKLLLEDDDGKRLGALPPHARAELAKIREQGYGIVQSSQVASVTNLSVPVLGPLGSVIGVLTSPYTERLDKKDAPNQKAALKLLIAAAKEISARTVVRE